MPVSCEILTVSESDGEDNGESVRKDCQRRSRKRSKHKQKRKLVNPIDQETRLRCILGRPCWCKHGRCLQQFLPADVFSSLLDYRTSLHSLHKIDQDHCVFGLTSVFCLCFVYDQAIVVSSWAFGSWNPRPFLRNQGFASDTWPCDASAALQRRRRSKRCVEVEKGPMESARVSSLRTCLEEVAQHWFRVLHYYFNWACSIFYLFEDKFFFWEPLKRIEELFSEC